MEATKKEFTGIVKKRFKMENFPFSASEKIRIGTGGRSSEIGISEICTREGVDPEMYYEWCKNFLQNDNGKFVIDLKKKDTSLNVFHFENENIVLKYFVEELKVENKVLKNRLSHILQKQIGASKKNRKEIL